MGKPTMIDMNAYIQAGIDPKTGLPIKMTSGNLSNLKESTRSILRIVDEQNAVNRFTWYNLPDGLTGELLERILYYKGQGMFFWMEPTDTFMFLPFALDGAINVYGEYMGVTPLPFTGTASTETGDGKVKPWIKGLIRNPQREVLLPDELTMDTWRNKCVLLTDYTKGIAQNITPRATLNEGLIEAESECPAFMRTALISSTGVAGMRVQSEDEQSNVKAAAAAATRSALTGEKWIPVVGQIDFQSLDTSSVAQASEFMMAMNSLDNLRLTTHGLTNGGMFEKQGTILQSEADASSANVSLILNDGLRLRQEFCTIVNSIWGLGIWCETTMGPNMMGSSQAPGEEPEEKGKKDDKSAEDKEVSENE